MTKKLADGTRTMFYVLIDGQHIRFKGIVRSSNGHMFVDAPAAKAGFRFSLGRCALSFSYLRELETSRRYGRWVEKHPELDTTQEITYPLFELVGHLCSCGGVLATCMRLKGRGKWISKCSRCGNEPLPET